MKQKTSGFTMLELIVVVAILAILLTMAVPAFKSFSDKNHLKGAAEVFYNNLQLAKSEAILRNKDIFVSIQKGVNWCMGTTDKNTCNCTAAVAAGNACTFGKNASLVLRTLKSTDFKNITMTNSTTLTNFTIRSIRGLPSNVGTAIFVNPNNLYISVKLSTLGRVRICSNPNDTNPKGIAGYPTNQCLPTP